MTPACKSGSFEPTADPIVDGNDRALSSEGKSLESKSSNENDDQKIDEDKSNSSSLLPPITATLVDDEASSMDIAFLSMQQLLGDPTTSDTSVPSAQALEPSIVSGTTDLFEGDLCDDGELIGVQYS